MTTQIDLGKRHDEGKWAKYLPAISTFYATFLGKLEKGEEGYIPENRCPKGLELGLQGINYFRPDGSYYHYPYSLYSAGHAELNLNKCAIKEPMIHKRDKKTTLIGDSGGFQIATGVFKLDWSTFSGPGGDPMREKILRWLEHTADWSMTLDIPAVAYGPKFTGKTGLTTFQQTLDVTLVNLEYFARNRVPGATKFLNVLSGSTFEDSKQWFDAVYKYSKPDEVEKMGMPRSHTLEGYAFGGLNMRNMRTTLHRIVDLVEHDIIADKDWMHFLGVGRLDWACYLTSLERAIRANYNPNVNVSFDAASPFVAAGGYALGYTYNHFSSERLTYAMDKAIDDKNLKGSQLAMPYQGPIMERLKVGDICYMGPNDMNKVGKIGKTSWDITSYALIMAHNVFNHIQAVQEINRLADIEYVTRTNINYQDWYVLRNMRKKSSLSAFVPNTILFFNDFVHKLLDKKLPIKKKRAMIESNQQFLDYISFGETSGNNFNQHFDTTPVAEVDEQELLDLQQGLSENPDDDIGQID